MLVGQLYVNYGWYYMGVLGSADSESLWGLGIGSMADLVVFTAVVSESSGVAFARLHNFSDP
jgi:hypothetical protein